MKHILLALLACCVFGAHAQVYHFRAVQFACPRLKGQPLEPPEFRKLDSLPVSFDNDSSIVRINKTGIFRLQKDPFDYDHRDSVMTLRFWAIDPKGVQCIVRHVVYESATAPYFASFWLDYPDKTFVYYVQKE